MVSATEAELLAVIEDLRQQVAALAGRVAGLEKPPAPTVAAHDPAPAPAPPAAEPAIPEEEILAISAALAAYLGVRAHIRQIRLIGSRVWAQEGRVSIQASHRLHS